TEPSALSHEILTARPYAFLDDGEAADRRTRAVPLRRTLPLDPSNLGALDPVAVAEVRAELAPNPRTADELHDLLRDLVLLAAHEPWRLLFDELAARGRAVAIAWAGAERWHPAEAEHAVAVLTGGPTVADPRQEVELFPEQVAATVVRGHLELHSPATEAELGRITGLPATLLKVALATLETEGSAIQGRFTGRADAGGEPTVEWCTRRLLARMHGRSRGARRRSVQPVNPEQLVRFLTRWQHAAPGARVASADGLARLVEQLQGWEAAVAAWEPDLLAGRLERYDARWIDQLCHAGELQWLRLSPRAAPTAPDRRGGGPSKATPITILYRHDLPWLLAAGRGDAEPGRPAVGAVAEVAEALERHGPRFLTELTVDTGRLAPDVEAALWDGVARGLFTADGFEAVRSLTAGGPSRHEERQARALSRLRRQGVRAAHGAGRWALVPPVVSASDGRAVAEPAADRHDLAEALADQLLARWGVLFYDLYAHENLAVPWRELQWALRRLEDRGLVRGGRFVKGFSGEQFALPEAVEGLNQIRRHEPSGQTVTVCGCDPLNLTAVILPGPRIPSRRTERVVLPV
ncbi:MAG: DEAD/DEAH box helicase, partial [Acidimicrobiia bacterium]|nr:DEAD/DEAH box helicase [Acidimicrobiia bacterium]